MLWCQNSITHSSQTPSSSGSLAIRIRIDARAAAGQCPQQMQSSSLTTESLIVPNPLLNRYPWAVIWPYRSIGPMRAVNCRLEPCPLTGFRCIARPAPDAPSLGFSPLAKADLPKNTHNTVSLRTMVPAPPGGPFRPGLPSGQLPRDPVLARSAAVSAS